MRAAAAGEAACVGMCAGLVPRVRDVGVRVMLLDVASTGLSRRGEVL